VKLLIAALAGTAALALAGTVYSADPAPSASTAATDAAITTPGACFRTQQIRNHTIGDDHTLYLSVNRDEVFRLDMKGSCLATASPTDPLVIERKGGSNMVCNAIDLDLRIATPSGPSPCIIDRITKLTEAEAAALPPKLRP
jgi:hypothetical protein